MALEPTGPGQINRRELLRLGLYGALAAGTGIGLDACARGPAFHGPARHVILISLDTARRDHFGCYQESCLQTPHIDSLARESILFHDHITPVTTTLASHTSTLTGKYPHNHGVPRNGFMLNTGNTLLTEILQEAGFHTAGFLGSFALDSRFGFASGFRYFDESFDILCGDQGADQNQRTAARVTDTVAAYLDRTGIPGNLFLFAHYFDPHQPYSPPGDFATMYGGRTGHPPINMQNHPVFNYGHREPNERAALMRYAGEISYLDAEIGRLLAYLRERDILDNAILIMTSDHGEHLGDAPGGRAFDHGWTVAEPEIRSVCMMRLPGGRSATECDIPTSHIDILPTLTNYLGLPTPPGVDGVAIPLDEPASLEPRTLFAEATKPWKEAETDRRWFNFPKARCARGGNYKYVQTAYRKEEALYDLSRDPHEQRNLLGDPDEQATTAAGRLRADLKNWTNSAHPLPTRFEQSQQRETIARLRSLGYLK